MSFLRGFQERVSILGEFRSDTVYAARQLVRTPSFAVVSILILAFGIGANTAIFTLLDSLLFQQLPISAPDELRRLEWSSPKPAFVRRYSGSVTGGYRSSLAYPHFQYLRDRARTFSEVFCFGLPLDVNATIDQNRQLIKGHVVSGNYFRGLGVSAALGRTLTEDDDRPTASPVAVVTYGFWQRVLGADPAIVGRSIVVNGVPFAVVGVTSRAFRGVIPGASVDIMMPTSMHSIVTAESDVLRQSGDWQFIVIGRLAKGGVDDQARVEVETLLRQAIAAEPPAQPYELPQVRMVSGGRGAGLMAQDALSPLLALLGVVVFVLLIACANLTGMLGARSSARAREIGTRLALGASRRRLIRQLLTESVLLSAVGGLVGIGFAYVFVAVIPSALTLLGSGEITINASPNIRVLAFTVGLCVLTGIVFGLAPALRTTRLDLVSMLKVTFGASTEQRRSRLGRALIAMQVALSFVLLVCAGLFARNLSGVNKASPGFDTENILLFKANPGLNGLKEVRLLDFYEEALRRIRLNPSVRSATASYSTILSSGSISFQIPVRRDGGPTREIRIRVQPIAPGYFKTMGIPMLLGTDFTWDHREGSQQVAIINQALAKEAFSEQTPLGQDFGPRQITGVVADVKHSLIQAPQPTLYVPYRQYAPLNAMLFSVRTAGDPTAVLPEIYRVFSNLDSNLPLSDIRTQVAQVGESVAPHRVMAMLLALFGFVSVLLACLGIYGTLSYSATRRTPEIGIRLALGAQRSSVLRAIARESLAPVAVGIVVGLLGALAASNMLEFMFFGVSPTDPVALGGAAFFLLLAATLAAFFPARRASRIDPIKALRYD